MYPFTGMVAAAPANFKTYCVFVVVRVCVEPVTMVFCVVPVEVVVKIETVKTLPGRDPEAQISRTQLPALMVEALVNCGDQRYAVAAEATL
jgi:hypothetical protein